ncbi:MAG TPA: hypothetical protein ENO23_05905, partial [Alphaproteobacteria bacterium]|nr:hypothetical protein [Alphaproteobacteria bacterium]
MKLAIAGLGIVLSTATQGTPCDGDVATGDIPPDAVYLIRCVADYRDILEDFSKLARVVGPELAAEARHEFMTECVRYY